MPSPPRLPRALVTLILRGEVREVIVGDLDQEFAEAITAGVRPAVARRMYWRQAIASVVAIRRGGKEARAMTASAPFRPLGGLSLDLKSVSRAFRRSPGYAALAVFSLAIGIGANTTIFSVVRQVLLMPLPVERPDELRLIYWSPRQNGPLGILTFNGSGYRDPGGTSYRSNVNYRQYSMLRQSAAGLADVAGYNFLERLTVSVGRETPVVASGMMASGNLFGVVRPPLAFGRGLTDRDDAADAPLVTVISDSLWSRLFDRDPAVVGKTLHVNGHAAAIVGVTAASYRGLSPGGFFPAPDVTVPLASQPLVTAEWSAGSKTLAAEPSAYWVRMIARIRPDADAPLRDALQAVFPRLLLDSGMRPAIATSAGIGVFPGSRGLDSLRTSTRIPLRILGITVGLVLLVGCINVAGLMLARGVWRQREFAVRRALGASRARIVRELFVESGVLSLTGGVAGLLFAVWMAPALQALLSAGLGTSGVSVVLDWPLVGMNAAICCVAAMLAGMLPAIRLSRGQDGLLAVRRDAGGAPRLAIGRALLTFQVALSLPLVVGAGLFLRTLHNLGQVDLGFDPRGVTLFTVDPTMSGTAGGRTSIVFPVLLERLQSIPGVTSATVVQNALVAGENSYAGVTIGGQKAEIDMNVIGPRYLETMGIRLVAGRQLLPTDTASAPLVILLNESAARQHFGGIVSAIGRSLTWAKHEYQVVGVAADSKYGDLRLAPKPMMFQSYLQRAASGFPISTMVVAVRSAVPAAGLRASIDSTVREVAPGIPITDYRSQQEQIDQTVSRELIFSRLLTAFGGFALLLAAVGIHGVTSYSVARRTSEIGIRLALGARRPHVLWMIFRQVIVPVAAGLAIGLPIAWFASPVAGALLFDLQPRDPGTIAAAAALIVIVAVVGALRPARQAARMQAVTAMRSE